jgi:hypothetical protein
MMSSSRDTLLFMISCGRLTVADEAVFGWKIDSVGAMALDRALSSAGLSWAITLTEMMMGLAGIMALASFFGVVATTEWRTVAFLIFISGAVVEVLHSGQLLLYSASLRPHFRQNGICSLNFFMT